MIVMQLANIKKSFVTDLIFKNINLEIKSGETLGIVGKNGAGKTTLMKIMAGDLSYDEGTLSVPKNTSVGYLTQQMTLESNRTVHEEMLKPFADLLEMRKEMEEITQWLSAHEYSHPNYDDQLNRFESLQNRFEASDGYNIETKIKTVMTGLNFSPDDLNRHVEAFSGGQKTRLALGQMLLFSPDLLLLDEPTNHLDMTTVAWLEQYLNSFKGAVVIISHDRYFLDRTVDKIFEVEMFKGTLYHTDYSRYTVEKRKQFNLEMKAYEEQQKEIEKLETFVAKNIARASTSNMAKSRRKKLESMDRIEKPMQDSKNANFSFDIQKESGNDVLRVKNLSIGYEQVLNESISFSVDKGDRVAVIGPNGIGKSTLVKTIAGMTPELEGEIGYGANVSIGYYDQKQAEFTSSRTVLEELWHEYPHMNESDVRAILGRFLFTQEEVKKTVNDLSGGEKARIQLAKLMLEKNNLLILDEPTNHLDIDSKEVLERALQNYPGTIVFVSHDRYFIDRIASTVIEMGEREIGVYNGDYSYYKHKKEEYEATQLKEESTNKKNGAANSYEAQKKLRNEQQRLEKNVAKIENDITNTESDIESIEQELLKPEVYEDYAKAQEYNQKLNEKNDELESLMAAWEQAEEQLDDE